MLTLENKIVKAADKARALREQMAALKNEKIPTAEYAEISKQIDKANTKINQLISQQQSMYLSGQQGTAAFQKIDDKISELHEELQYANGELKDLVDTGKAFTLGEDSTSYKNLSSQLRYEEANLSALTLKHEELSQKQNENARNYTNIGKKGTSACNLISRAISKILTLSSKVGKSALSAIKTLTSSILPKMNSHVRTSNTLFGTLGKRIQSLAASAFLFNVLSSAFRSMVNGVKDSLKSYYTESDTFKRSVGSLYNSFNQLKANIASAFASLIQIAVPYLKTLISYVNQAVEAVSQLIAAFTGQNTFKHAVLGTGSALEEEASAADKAKESLEGYLSPIDEINKYKTNNAGDTSSGSGAGAATTYEDIPIDSKWKNIASWLKEMWKNADFSELGKTLGEKLAESLANIPWNNIKTQARKLGKSFATLINGFIESEFDGIGLGWWIGHTLAEAVNTGFEFLNSFVHEFHFDSLGQFLADSLNGLFESIDWELIKDTFVTGAKGIADVINNFDEYFHWDNISATIANVVNTLVDTIIEFTETVDWSELGKNVGDQLMKAIEKIDWENVGRAIGDVLHSAIVFVAGILSEMDWSEIIDAVKDLLKGFFEAFDNSELPDDIASIADALQTFGAILATLVAIKGITDFATTIGAFFKLFTGSSLATSIGTTSTALSGLAARLTELFAIIAGGEAAYQILTNAITRLGEAEGRNSDQVDAIKERYGGELFTSAFNAASDAVGGLSAKFEGLPYALEGTIGKLDALDQMMDAIAEGTVYTDAQLQKAQQTWQLSADDVEMLRQAMFDANEATWTWSNAFPELDTASAQTIANITEGMALMQNGTITNEVELANLVEQSGYTNEAFTFLAESLSTNSASMISSVQNTSTEYSTFGDNVKTTNDEIKSNTEGAWDSMSSTMDSKNSEMESKTESSWQNISNTIKSKIQDAADECERIFSRIKSSLSSIGSGLSSGLKIGASVISGTTSSGSSYKGYATGTVMPKTAQPHLAWFGDNNRETEVVSPLSTIKQALREEMAAGGNGNTNNRPIVIKQYLDSYQVSEALIDNGRVQQMSTGRNAYVLE